MNFIYLKNHPVCFAVHLNNYLIQLLIMYDPSPLGHNHDNIIQHDGNHILNPC